MMAMPHNMNNMTPQLRKARSLPSAFFLLKTSKKASFQTKMNDSEESMKIAAIRRQTALTDEAEIRAKLAAFGGDELCVIKDALGLPTTTDKGNQSKAATACSLNQEIYRQLRKQLGVQDEKKAKEAKQASTSTA